MRTGRKRLRRAAPLSPLIPVERRRRRRTGAAAGLLLVAVAAVVALAAWQVPGRLDAGDSTSSSAAPTAERPARELAVAPRHRAKARPATPRPLAAKPLLVDGRRLRTRLHRPVHARGAILVNATTGRVLYVRHPHRRLPIASTTKIMTGLLAVERLHPRRKITVLPKIARVQPFREGLRAGERVRVWKLLYGLMLYSGNDDALALALATSGSRKAFLRLMNQRANELGMRNSHFTSPSGVVDRGNYSSAWDMATLARYAMRNARFRAVVRTKVKRVRWSAPTFGKIYVNKNPLLGTYRGADGIKTGWTTKADHCLVASAHRRGVRLIAVVLGVQGDAGGEARRLLDLGFRSLGLSRRA
jgi:D-alanyl-D-alanine carboxypeptidase